VTRLLIATYLIEAGIVLILGPWSSWWQPNRFADFIPVLDALMPNRYFRGAVSGVGLVTTIIGMRELLAVLLSRRRLPPPEPAPVEPPAP
jgi:hypothetical protein